MAMSAACLTAFSLLCLLALISVRGGEAAVVDVSCENSLGDAELLNSAINGSSKGDSIAIHGVCLLSSTIVLHGDRSYLGDSRTGTVLKQADGVNLPAVLASDSWASNSSYTGAPVRIAHLTVRGNGENNNGTTGLIIRSWMTVIEDILVAGCPEDGLRLTNLASDGTTGLLTSQVNGHISNCFVEKSGRHGIYVLDTGNSVTDWSLLDCWVANSGGSGILLDNAAGWQVRGNHIYGVGDHALFGKRCYATAFAGNYIEDFGGSLGDAQDSWFGIGCTVQGTAGSIIADNKVFQLRGSPVSPARYVYIGIEVNYGVGVANVANNLVRGGNGPNDTGLLFQVGGGDGLDVLTSANNVQNATNPRKVGPGVNLVQGW